MGASVGLLSGSFSGGLALHAYDPDTEMKEFAGSPDHEHGLDDWVTHSLTLTQGVACSSTALDICLGKYITSGHRGQIYYCLPLQKSDPHIPLLVKIVSIDGSYLEWPRGHDQTKYYHERTKAEDFMHECHLAQRMSQEKIGPLVLGFDILELSNIFDPRLKTLTFRYDAPQTVKLGFLVQERYAMDLAQYQDKVLATWNNPHRAEQMDCMIREQVDRLMDRMHALNIAHNDIECERNIVMNLDSYDEPCDIRIIDWGMGSAIDSHAEYTRECSKSSTSKSKS